MFFDLTHDAVAIVDEVDLLLWCVFCSQWMAALNITVVLARCRHNVDGRLALTVGHWKGFAPCGWTLRVVITKVNNVFVLFKSIAMCLNHQISS